MADTASVDDLRFMARALQLARRGRYTTSPNPQVGCVIVRDGQVVGEGWHKFAGQGHAEVNALAAAGDMARGATAYVTLEPCSHHGRTPPCSQALVAAGIARVVGAMVDPNPQVGGDGFRYLRDQGVAVSSGVLELEARALLSSYEQSLTSGKPRVLLKLAASLDGRSAMASGESQWITGPEARSRVQALRAESCAVITGINTVLADDCSLNVRPEAMADAYPGAQVRQPLRVVLDSALRMPAAATMLSLPGSTLLAHGEADASRRQALEAAGALLWQAPVQQSGLDLAAMLGHLAQAHQCHRVLVEAGPRLAGSFLRQGLVDEFHLFQAPVLLGSSARPLLELPLDKMADSLRLDLADQRRVGADQYYVFHPRD